MQSLFISNELQEEFKSSIKRYLHDQSDEEAKTFIKEILNNDFEIQYQNMKEDPLGCEDYISNLDWLLYLCIDLANNQATKNTFNLIQKAVSNRQLIDCL